MLNHCIICHDVIWHTEGGLCLEHRQFAVLWSAVAAGVPEVSDWPDRLVSSREMQLDRSLAATTSWLVALADINRFARYWLDGWDDAGDGGIAA